MPSWIAVVITSSVIASFINVGGAWLRDHLRERRVRREDASMSALYVALQFERYARDCADLVGNLDVYLDTDGDAGEAYSRLPGKPESAVDVDWKALGVALTAKYLHFWVFVESANARLSNDFEYGDDEDAARDLLDEAVGAGLLAIEVAEELRLQHRLPAREDDASAEYLADRRSYFEARRVNEDNAPDEQSLEGEP